VEGDLSQLRVPVERAGGELWQHTCFEIFLAPRGMPSYFELNFSPAGDWAAYAFSAYRQGARLADEGLDPHIRVETSENKITLEATVALGRLGLTDDLDVGISTVIEASDGALSYWALRHSPGKPDFHHRDAFAARLDAVRD
jgi:hypothetical protein